MGRRPAEGAFHEPECVLDVKAPQVGTKASFEVHRAGSGPPQPQCLVRPATRFREVLDVDADDGAAHDRQFVGPLAPTPPVQLGV